MNDPRTEGTFGVINVFNIPKKQHICVFEIILRAKLSVVMRYEEKGFTSILRRSK